MKEETKLIMFGIISIGVIVISYLTWGYFYPI